MMATGKWAHANPDFAARLKAGVPIERARLQHVLRWRHQPVHRLSAARRSADGSSRRLDGNRIRFSHRRASQTYVAMSAAGPSLTNRSTWRMSGIGLEAANQGKLY